MGKRIRLAKGLLDGSLTADEKAEALANSVISKMAEDMKAASAKENKTSKTTKKGMVNNG